MGPRAPPNRFQAPCQSNQLPGSSSCEKILVCEALHNKKKERFLACDRFTQTNTNSRALRGPHPSPGCFVCFSLLPSQASSPGGTRCPRLHPRRGSPRAALLPLRRRATSMRHATGRLRRLPDGSWVRGVRPTFGQRWTIDRPSLVKDSAT